MHKTLFLDLNKLNSNKLLLKLLYDLSILILIGYNRLKIFKKYFSENIFIVYMMRV